MYRGVGAVTGLAATWLFPFLGRTWGLTATGLAGIWLQARDILFLIQVIIPVLVLILTVGGDLAAGRGCYVLLASPMHRPDHIRYLKPARQYYLYIAL